MWQYTTETIINSNVGNLEGDVRALILNADGSSAGNVSGAELSDESVLLIDGVNAFLKKYVKRLTKYAYRAAANEVGTLTINNESGDEELKAGDVVRLEVLLREEGRQSAIMQDAYLHHTKPFHFEITVTDPDKVVEDLAKAVNKVLALSDIKFFRAVGESGVLTLTAADCHIRFVDVTLDKIDALSAESPLPERILGYGVATPIATWEVTTPGDCGAGTVEHLIKDLRLPTNASINPFAADQGGRPIPGGKYDQYLLEYEVPRAHVAHGVMGSVGEVSRTSHVFFLEQTGAAEVAALLEQFGDLKEITKPAESPETKVAEPGSVQ